MPVESASDLAGFFDTDDFAETGQWTLAAGGAPTSVPVILSRSYGQVAVGDPGLQMDQPVAMMALAGLPAGYARGDTLTAGGITWRVGPIALDDSRAVATVTLRAM